MGPLPQKVRRFCTPFKRPLTRIQAHRRIERVEIQPAVEIVMKCGAGKALKKNHEGDGAGVNKFNISKN